MRKNKQVRGVLGSSAVRVTGSPIMRTDVDSGPRVAILHYKYRTNMVGLPDRLNTEEGTSKRPGTYDMELRACIRLAT